MPEVQPSDAPTWVGKETGVSDWVLIDQARINAFADVTEDWQFIHVEPEKAAATPFGGAIAHGFLTLSMLSKLASECVLRLDGVKMGVNYGFEKVRMMSPVRAGKRIRGRFVLAEADERGPGQWRFKYNVKVEIEDEEKPALIAEWVTMQFV
ncbi:MAG: Nodulation protein N [Alphaproteobacteria bacterium]|nr:Nodulation protein N [Alphaproteobacteria bacterium]